ncbi:MAG TPA: amino acid permease [Gammaproteobacteria bacterium]|nr:amino acid permease [Gammaproteobacteria bacterium]
MSIFRTKPVVDDGEKTGLRKVLGPIDLTLMGIGCVIGAGIFVLTGQAAALHAGPAIVLSFVAAGIACAFSALSYAELASTIGGCGSAYGYGYATLGEIIGWIIGWDLILEYGFGVSTVAVGWSGYMNNALTAMGIHLPVAITAAPGVGGTVNVLAIFIVAVVTVLLCIGTKLSARFNGVMVAIKLIVLLIFIGVALFFINPELWHPFIPERAAHALNDPANGPAYGWTGIMTGAATVFFAYIGFDSVSTATEETRNPQRNVPIGIIGSLVICTLLYIAVSGLLTGIVPYSTLNTPSPISDALIQLDVRGMAGLVAVGAIAGLTTVCLVLFFGLTRIFLAMSRDGLLPPVFASVNKRTGTPIRIIVISGVLMAVVAGFTPIDKLATLVNIGTLAAFTVVCAGVIWLRYKHPELPRPFKTPFTPLFPALGVFCCIALMLFLPGFTWMVFFIWLIIGLLVYGFYGYRNSKMAKAA